jgi:hypothetical protein
VWRFYSRTRKRGDLGQLAPRKKLLKSFSSFPEDFLRPSEHFGTEGFFVFSSALPESNSTFWTIVLPGEARRAMEGE